jgi:TfoX/Sxy family transcriptional regulator of competence genes
MAYDEVVANRVRRSLSKQGDFDERRMFGGLAFMVGGHMCCGVVGSEIMVRVGADGYARALAAPHARAMDFTGRPLTGMVYVAPAGFKNDKALDAWVERGLAFVRSLPPRGPRMAVARSPRAGRRLPR